VDVLMQDLRYAGRSLIRARGFVIAAVLALALGVGATTALFSVVWAVLLKPLPYASPDRLVTILHGSDVNNPVSPADYFDLRRAARSFANVAAAQAWSANLSADGRTDRIAGLQVSPQLFDVLGVRAASGRTLSGSGEIGRDSHVVVLGHGLWTRRFGADRTVIGKQIRLNGEPYTIAAVMPRGFTFAPFWQTQAELWVPLDLTSRRADRAGRSLRVFARLADGVDLDRARAEVRLLNDRLVRAHPDTNRGLTTGVALLSEKAERRVRPTILATFGMAAVVLLIACANVTTLSLARAVARSRELAVRVALGAGRARVTRLLVAEGLLLGIAAALLGLVVAAISINALVRFLPADALPPHATIAMAPAVALFALAVAIVGGVAATVAPVLHLRVVAPAETLRGDGRASIGSRSSGTLRQIMVGTEVALAVTLLALAGLFARTLLALRHVDPGFRADGAAATSVSTDGTSVSTAADRVRFYTAAMTRIAALPGVTAVGAINHLPLFGDVWTFRYRIEGRAAPEPGAEPAAVYRVVSPGYFRAIAQPLIAGRDFEDRDAPGGVQVAIVNRALAARWWPDGNALGARLAFASEDGPPVYMTIVGIAGNVLQRELTSDAAEEIYVPLAQRPGDSASRSPMTIVARTNGDAGSVLPLVRDAVWAEDKQAAVYEAITLPQVLDRELWRERLAADLVAVFALAALTLAAVGIQGILAYTVSQRRREFGLRLALGASAQSIRALAARDAVVPVTAGLVSGVLLALGAGRALERLLVGTSPHDPLVIGGTVGILAAAGALAAWRPAARAAAVDPVIALRSE
jgi:predicted permease